MSIRPIPAGQDPSFTWGPLGKRKRYVNQAFKSVPNLSTDERRELLNKKMKPYNSQDYLGKEIFVVGGGEPTTPVVSPSNTPTPTITATQTTTPTPTPTITPTNTPTITPTETSTPTPTPSSAPLSDLDYIIYAQDSVDRATYTFSAVNYGGPGLIIVGVHAFDDPGSQTLGTPTISGFTMTEVVKASALQGGSAVRFMSGLFSYRMTGGTSANIVVPFTNTIQFCSISVWRLTNNISDTAFDTDFANVLGSALSNTISLNLNTGRNHLIALDSRKQGTTTATWTNVTEDYDFQMEANGVATAGSELYIGSGTTSVTVNGSGTLNTLVGATWN
jgi:hypothetical protein